MLPFRTCVFAAAERVCFGDQSIGPSEFEWVWWFLGLIAELCAGALSVAVRRVSPYSLCLVGTEESQPNPAVASTRAADCRLSPSVVAVPGFAGAVLIENSPVAEEQVAVCRLSPEHWVAASTGRVAAPSGRSPQFAGWAQAAIPTIVATLHTVARHFAVAGLLDQFEFDLQV